MQIQKVYYPQDHHSGRFAERRFSGPEWRDQAAADRRLN
jgi:hypothetical protein